MTILSLVFFMIIWTIFSCCDGLETLHIPFPKLLEKHERFLLQDEYTHELTVHAMNNTFRLRLKIDDELFAPNFQALVFRGNQNEGGEPMKIDKECIFVGKVKDHEKSNVFLSFCDQAVGVVSGSIDTGDDMFHIGHYEDEDVDVDNEDDGNLNHHHDHHNIKKQTRIIRDRDLRKRRKNQKPKSEIHCGSDSLPEDVDLFPMDELVANGTNITQYLEDNQMASLSQANVKYVKIALISDVRRFRLKGSKSSNVLASTTTIAGQIKKIYANFPSTKSGFSIRIQVIAFLSFESVDPWTTPTVTSNGEIDPSSLLNSFSSWRSASMNSGLLSRNSAAHLLSGYDFSGTVVGLASLSKVCDAKYGAGVNQATSTSDEFVGKIVAHELGHNLGLRHANSYVPGSEIPSSSSVASDCLVSSNVMSPSLLANSPSYTWDSCSPIWLKMFFRGYPYDCLSNECSYARGYNSIYNQDMCLETPADKVVLEGKQCGDGIKEGDEECDCGTPEQCALRDPCCDPSTCMLKDASECSAEDDCCNKNTCKIVKASENLVCRKSSSECDIEERCNGLSSKCPNNSFKPLGTVCSLKFRSQSEIKLLATNNKKTGICYNGECNSHEEQCNELYSTGLFPKLDGQCPQAGDEIGGTPSCKFLICKEFNSDFCQTYFKLSNYVYTKDGTPCGKNKACMAGICIDYEPITESPTTKEPTTTSPTNTLRPTTSSPTNTLRPTTSSPTNTLRPTTSSPTNTLRPTTSSPTNTLRPTTSSPTNTLRPTTSSTNVPTINDEEEFTEPPSLLMSPTKVPTRRKNRTPTKFPFSITPTTRAPTNHPVTKMPTRQPSTKVPTNRPTTKAPTNRPITKSPTTILSTNSPTTQMPTFSPTEVPTMLPTSSPTKAPTLSPTEAPTLSPTEAPTSSPTEAPTLSPTKVPTLSPTETPTKSPTQIPTKSPTKRPTRRNGRRMLRGEEKE